MVGPFPNQITLTERILSQVLLVVLLMVALTPSTVMGGM